MTTGIEWTRTGGNAHRVVITRMVDVPYQVWAMLNAQNAYRGYEHANSDALHNAQSGFTDGFRAAGTIAGNIF